MPTKSEQMRSYQRLQGLHEVNERSKQRFESAVRESLFSKADTAKIVAALKEKKRKKSDRTAKAKLEAA